MLTGVHFLLTYRCNYECDHCFLYCGPGAAGVFTIAQIDRVLTEAERIGTVQWIYFEGGEPFLYHPLLLEGLRRARQRGFRTGVVTNGYWATDAEDIELWIAPLEQAGVAFLSVSDDDFHNEPGQGPAHRVEPVASRLGIPSAPICIEQPTSARETEKGAPVEGGGVLFKGRAADKLTGGLPTRPSDSFTACPHEELVAPKRVHVDPLGHVHICQGVSMGNLWQRPLSELVAAYDPSRHPICGPLVRGGPAELARTHDVRLDGEFVDECHHCFAVRRALVDRFPDHLAPRQVYGLEVAP